MGPGRRRGDTEALAPSSPVHRVSPAKAGAQLEIQPPRTEGETSSPSPSENAVTRNAGGHPVPGRAAPGSFARARADRTHVT